MCDFKLYQQMEKLMMTSVGMDKKSFVVKQK